MTVEQLNKKRLSNFTGRQLKNYKKTHPFMRTAYTTVQSNGRVKRNIFPAYLTNIGGCGILVYGPSSYTYLDTLSEYTDVFICDNMEEAEELHKLLVTLPETKDKILKKFQEERTKHTRKAAELHKKILELQKSRT